MVKIHIAESADAADIAEVRQLFEEYAASLGVDLGFQGFPQELAGLPGAYAAPGGTLLLARLDGVVVGCVAVRPLQPPDVAELKRLYVRDAGRGHGLGLALSEAAIAFARVAGYARLRLDTLPDMLAARRLYAGLGFREIAPYRHNPVAGTSYLELDLRAPSGAAG